MSTPCWPAFGSLRTLRADRARRRESQFERHQNRGASQLWCVVLDDSIGTVNQNTDPAPTVRPEDGRVREVPVCLAPLALDLVGDGKADLVVRLARFQDLLRDGQELGVELGAKGLGHRMPDQPLCRDADRLAIGRVRPADHQVAIPDGQWRGHPIDQPGGECPLVCALGDVTGKLQHGDRARGSRPARRLPEGIQSACLKGADNLRP